MAQIVYLILADTDSPGEQGRAVNALEGAQESIEAGDDTQIIFDGAGTKWIAELDSDDNDHSSLYTEISSHITGACEDCAEAHGVKDAIRKAGIRLLNDHPGHPSLRELIEDGYQIITF